MGKTMTKPTKEVKIVTHLFSGITGLFLLSQCYNWRASHLEWEISPKENIPWHIVVPGAAMIGTSLGVQIDPRFIDALLRSRNENR